MKKNLRPLHCKVSSQTMRNLERLAAMEKCSVGRVVDKLMRDKMVAMRWPLRKENEKDWNREVEP